MKARKLFLLVLLFSTVPGRAFRTAPPVAYFQTAGIRPGRIQVSVTDQNGQPLSQATVGIQSPATSSPIFEQRTTPTGTVSTAQLPPGAYRIQVQRPGFYTATIETVDVVSGETVPIEVKMQPVREFQEQVEVTAQPSPIDVEQTASSQSLNAEDITNIPYRTTRDYRNVLPYIPGVIADTSGQIHVAGSSTQEIQDYLDGFEVSQPAGGSLGVRVNPDSLRKIDVRSSRYSAQFGKGSGGVTDLEVQDGDNHFRINATDVFPTLQRVKGFNINSWTPRSYFSGPLLRDKAWFDLSHEGEYDLNIVKELPDGADTNRTWRTADLGRLKLDLTPGNVLTFTSLLDLFDSRHAGISPFDPVSVSFNNHSSLYVLALKDQISIAKNTLFEFGTSFHRTHTSTLPLGALPYVLGPEGRSGNYWVTSQAASSRVQSFTNLFLRPMKWYGTHQFTLGGRVDRVVDHADTHRGLVQFVDASSNVLRQISYSNPPLFSLSTLESSAFVEDRWSPAQRMVIETGGRWDRDSFLGRNMFSPRGAGTILLSRKSETKLSAGIGVYYDRTNLATISQTFQGTRTDEVTPHLSVATFLLDRTRLQMPRFVNWSAAIERRLPFKVYARVDYLSRHGDHGWAYEALPNNIFLLQNNKQDRYDGVQLTLRRELKRGYPALVSYTRSRAHSNETVDFAIDLLVTGNQVGGPLPWDAPNQLVTWGTYPLFWKLKKFDFAWSTLWRSGFPFPTVDQFGQLVSGPGQFRFPDYFDLNTAIERKFVFRNYRWAARVSVDNVTNSLNPTGVDSNVNSPTFLVFFGTSHRTFAGRLRFLGKK